VTRIDSRLERYRAFDSVNRPYLDWQLETFRPFLGQRLLEIGCGVGSLLELLAPRELLQGVDVEPDVLDFARQRFAGRPEFAFELLDAGRLDDARIDSLRQKEFDSLVCVNVLEHIEDDAATLGAFERILVPGGHLALLVPAHRWLYGSYDKLDGHFRRYSHAQLGALMRSAGFTVLTSRHFNMVGALGWWIQYRLLRRTIHGEGQFGLMNRLVPLVRPIERLLPPPFGLSLVAVGRKGKA
jgi:2-polyprenyl-3-methyl-5-hydroxy-6-metoxy-1,4-benzoquinol methylase